MVYDMDKMQLVLNKANDGIFSTASHFYVGLNVAEACLRYKHRLYLLIGGAVSTVMFPNDSWTMLDKTFLASCKHEKTKKTKIRLGNQTYNPCTLSKIWLRNTGASLASLKPSVGLLPKCNLNIFAVVGMGRDFEAMTSQCKARSQSSPKRVASANEVITSSQSSNTSWFVMIQPTGRRFWTLSWFHNRASNCMLFGSWTLEHLLRILAGPLSRWVYAAVVSCQHVVLDVQDSGRG